MALSRHYRTVCQPGFAKDDEPHIGRWVIAAERCDDNCKIYLNSEATKNFKKNLKKMKLLLDFSYGLCYTIFTQDW